MRDQSQKLNKAKEETLSFTTIKLLTVIRVTSLKYRMKLSMNKMLLANCTNLKDYS
jgi:hypothetical protein